MGLGIVDFYALLVVIASFGVFRLCGGALNFFNPAALFFLFHLVLLGVGSWYRGLYAGVVWVSDGLVFIVYTSLLLYSLGCLCVTLILRERFNRVAKYCCLVESYSRPWPMHSVFRLGIVLVPAAIALGYSLHVGGVVWNQSEIDDLRVEVRKGVGWIALLGIASAFVGVLLYVFSRKTIGWLEAILVLLLFSVCASAYGNRAPAADVFLAGFFSVLFVKYKRVPILPMAIAGSGLFLLVMAAGLYRQGFDLSVDGVLLQVLWRPFVNFQNFQLIYDAFPQKIPYQYGNGYLIDLAVLMPGYQPNYSTWLKDALGLTFTGGGVNQTYLGEFYSNFSLLPALCISFFLGAAFQLCYIALRSAAAGPHIMLIVAFSLKGMVSSGLVSPLMYYLLPLCFVYFLYTQRLFGVLLAKA